jgi:hypothetical protein
MTPDQYDDPIVRKPTRIVVSGVEVKPWPPFPEMAATAGREDSTERRRSRLARFRAAFPRWTW